MSQRCLAVSRRRAVDVSATYTLFFLRFVLFAILLFVFLMLSVFVGRFCWFLVFVSCFCTLQLMTVYDSPRLTLPIGLCFVLVCFCPCFVFDFLCFVLAWCIQSVFSFRCRALSCDVFDGRGVSCP